MKHSISIALFFAAAVTLSAQADPAKPPLPLSDAAHAGWEAIGQVNQGALSKRGSCTGTLIAPDLVLTAAHCAHVKEINGVRNTALVHFTAGWNRGALTAQRNAAQILFHPNRTPVPRLRLTDIPNDLALIRLDAPIPAETLTPLPVALSQNEPGPYAIISYSGARPATLSAHMDCTGLASVERVLALDCTVIGGNSGAPLLERFGTQWRITGVISARVDPSGPVRAYAALLDQTMLNLIAQELEAPGE